jgi:hypothetical protein
MTMQQKRLIRMPRLKSKTLLMEILWNQIIWTISFTMEKLVKKSLKKTWFDKMLLTPIGVIAAQILGRGV